VPVLDAADSGWVLSVVDPDASIAGVRGLRDGGAPWMLRILRDGKNRFVVLRVGPFADAGPLRTETAGLRVAAAHGVPVPRLIAADLDRDPPLVLTEAVAGSSIIPWRRPAARLRRLGAIAAVLHQVPAPSDPDLPTRDRPIQPVDFHALRRQRTSSPLLARAEQLALAGRPASASGFVHGDLWQGNTLWDGDKLVSIVDWDCAGVGPAGVDLGSLRCDASLCFGVPAADDVLGGWEHAAGRPADDVAYWDMVAALSTPPDIGWFVQAIGAQGRLDLTQAVLLDRRDEFLAVAVDRFNSPGRRFS
jgi:aminoglycoside phosphotransferase (APT) family kinase protein